MSLIGIVAAAVFWFRIRNHPSEDARISPEELAEIEAGSIDEIERGPFSLRNEISRPSVLKYFFIFFTFDTAYWGFTTWLPTYLVKVRGLSMIEMGMAASMPFLAGAVGRVLGGWLSDRYFADNRRTIVIFSQILSAGFLFVTFHAESTVSFLICQTLAGFFIHTFLSAFWAMPMTTLPRRSMGSSIGLISTGGQLGGFIAPLCIGALLEVSNGDFELSFMFMVAAVLLSMLITLLLPRKVHTDIHATTAL